MHMYAWMKAPLYWGLLWAIESSGEEAFEFHGVTIAHFIF